MKIVQANKAYYPHVGGIETVVRQVAEGILKSLKAESVVVVCGDKLRSEVRYHSGVCIKSAGTLFRLFSLPISYKYEHILCEERGDLLLLHEPFLLAPFVLWKNQKKLRQNFRKIIVWWHCDIIRQRFAQTFYEPLQHYILDQADHIIVATPNHISSSRILIKYAEKCRIIGYGIDTEILKSEEIKIKTCMLKKSPVPTILFVGRLVYYKGVEYLVEAMHQIPEAQLIVIGTGPLETKLKKMSSSNVTFKSNLSDADLWAHFASCDVFVLPSVEASEAFGIVQLQAMLFGKPVITSDLDSGVTYVNQNNKTGLVVPRRDPQALVKSIKMLLNDEKLRAEMGSYAQTRVINEYSLDSMINGVANLLFL